MKSSKNIVILLTKDCMPIEALPCYATTGAANYWRGKTPNIDELAQKGTMFMRHYTAAPSTAMAMSGMLTGHYPYEFAKRSHYVNASPSEFPSIFDSFQKEGYECHMIWDRTWIHMAWRFVREFGDEEKTIFHNLDIAQATAAHKLGDKRLERNDELLSETLKQIHNTLSEIDFSKKQFVWMHLPHILKGRRSYMDDMDVFDQVVGYVRNLVDDDCIFISSDHGHMNMHKGKISYGFDLYEPAIRIPLITPRIDGIETVIQVTSNIDLPTILFNREIPKARDYVVSDTKYYAQQGRKVSLTSERYKYIYNAADKSEELYDLEWDPQENYNILKELIYDIDRDRNVFSNEYYFYPYEKEALLEYDILKKAFVSFYKRGSLKERVLVGLRNAIGKKLTKFRKK